MFTKTELQVVIKTLSHRQDWLEKIRVLLADDDEASSNLMTALLHAMDIKHIDLVTDGLKAVSVLFGANLVYDLVLCDWHMPLKNDLDVHYGVIHS
ncbi:MAG TPA: hypothetical protein VLE50_02900 [Cellvibrio sp.]|nr:hypothetical protein [Cellvibrio sp.]